MQGRPTLLVGSSVTRLPSKQAQTAAAHLDERESRAARVRVAYLCRRAMLASYIPQVLFSPTSSFSLPKIR